MFISNKDNCCFKYIFDRFIESKENKEKKIRNIIPIKCRRSINLYDSPPLIGLKKYDNKSYVNSILQCLSQTESLTNYFLKKSIEELDNNQILGANNVDFPLTNAYYELIQNLWPNLSKHEKGASFSSNNFMEIFEKDSQINLTHPGAYKEFIILILNKIHNEKKKFLPEKKIDIKEPKDECNRQIAFNYYINDFIKETSIISDLFFGHIETISTCFICKRLCYSKSQIRYSYEKFNCLIFPLEKINNNKYNNYFVTLEDCFKYNLKQSNIECKYCHYPSKQAYYFIFPTILILILDRGNENLSNIKLIFEEIIDITQYSIQAVGTDKDKKIYNLYAVLAHIDQNHFVALCKNPKDNNWYRFDDENIVQINDFQKEVINFGNPDILFYQKI